MFSIREFLGFKDPSSVRLFLWLSVPWAAFLIWRLPSIDINGYYCIPENHPGAELVLGECHWIQNPSNRRPGIGFFLHLLCVIPAGLLAVLQFTPRIRQKYRTFHKYAGYVSTALVLGGNVGALMIMNNSFGGTVALQSIVIFFASMTTFALCKGVNEARHKRFESHRVWMLRAWIYLGSILTVRPLMGLGVALTFLFPDSQQYTAVPCDQMLAIMENNTATAYLKWPACDPSSPQFSADGMATVRATAINDDPVETTAFLHASFGAMVWVAVLIHTLAIEFYLNRQTVSKKTSKSEGVKVPAIDKRDSRALKEEKSS